MAAAVQVMHSSASSNYQQTPCSTAPVLEYVCLFTRDLRRKQKRWQDGRLKYHTFNKRIMVYDDRGNFVGDTHWHEDYDFDEGEELELERGGVIVQAAECTGSRDQDLSELVDKRARERAERQSAALARRPPTAEAATPHASAPHFQLRHMPLHRLIGTPTGHHGRALMPTESPYEERQKLAVSPRNNDARPTKRRKREPSPPSKGGYAQSLFGAALTLSGAPPSVPLIQSRPPRTPSILIDPESLTSSNLDHRDGYLGSTPTVARVATTDTREESQAHMSRTKLLKRVTQKSSTIRRSSSVELQSPQFPSKNRADLVELLSSPPCESQLRQKQKERTRSQAIEEDSLQPIPVNTDSRKSGSRKLHHSSFKDKQKLRDVGPLVASLVDESLTTSSLDVDPRTYVRNQVLGTEPDSKNKRKTWESNGERLLSREPTSEPRTELRIKPRKKRGLVMISEKSNSDNASISGISKTHPRDSPGDVTTGNPDNDIPNEDRCADTEADEANDHREEEQSASSYDVPPTETKSTCIRNTNIRRSRSELMGMQGEDDLAMLDLETRNDSIKKTDSPIHCSQADDVQTAVSEHEGDIFAETTRFSKSKKQPSRKKKTPSTRCIVNPYSTTGSDENLGTSDEEGVTLAKSAPAPHLAQLGRKSVRSKEVIGFVFNEEIDYHSEPHPKADTNEYDRGILVSGIPTKHPAVRSAALGANDMEGVTPNVDQGSANDRAQNHHLIRETGAAGEDAPAEYIESRNAPNAERMSRLRQKQPDPTSARISGDLETQATLSNNAAAARLHTDKMVVNPATRGRKAARPSDAAGQVPQCPLQSDIVPRKLSNTKRYGDNGTSVAPLPGFARANGGPWSREAHDLFEFTRPP